VVAFSNAQANCHKRVTALSLNPEQHHQLTLLKKFYFKFTHKAIDLRSLSNFSPNPCSIIKTINIKEILKAIQNVAYMGVLRQRWEEIKRLTNQSDLALS